MGLRQPIHRTQRPPALLCLAALAAITAPAAARAADADLDLIPGAALDAPSPATDTTPATAPAKAAAVTASLQAAAQGNLWREGGPLPAPDPARPDGRLRLSGELRGDWDLGGIGSGGSLRATVADRLDLIVAEGRRPTEDDAQNSLREAYLTYAPAAGLYFDLGRVNQKDGVAQGFNPSDRFADHAVKVRVSEDPAVLRDARLGAVMLRGQALWDGGALAFAYVPRLDDGQGQRSEASFDLGLDRSNRRHLGLVKFSPRLAEDLQPEIIVSLAEGERPELSTSLTRSVGDALVLTAEWSGGWRPSLAAAALADAMRTDAVPAGTPLLGPGDGARDFRSKVAAGAALTTSANLTLTLEYHYDQGAPGRDDWRRWVAAAKAGAGARSQFWLMRRHAQETATPEQRHGIFLRAAWDDAFIPDLDLTGLARISPYDGSAFLQLQADRHLSGATTLSMRVQGNLGHDASTYGSLPQTAAATLELTQHF